MQLLLEALVAVVGGIYAARLLVGGLPKVPREWSHPPRPPKRPQ